MSLPVRYIPSTRRLVTIAAVVFYSLILAQAVQAQPERLSFGHIGLESGLSSSSVLSITQDRRGFMWFGTQDGLNRFDGYDMIVHRSGATTTGGLAPGVIRTLMVDRDSVLWVGTFGGGLSAFDLRAEKILLFRRDSLNEQSIPSNYVISLHQDKSGLIWIGTYDGGLCSYDKRKKTFRRFASVAADSSTLGANGVWCIYEDSKGILWLGLEGGGLNALNRKTGEVTRYMNEPRNPSSLSDNNVVSIVEDGDGILWIGTYGGGLNAFDREAKSFRRVDLSGGDEDLAARNNVLTMLFDPHGVIWIGTDGGGLVAYNTNTHEYVAYTHDPVDDASISSNTVFSLYLDRGGLMWVGTDGGALNTFSDRTYRFTTFRHNPRNEGSLSSSDVWTILEDRDGKVWVGTYGKGLNEYDATRRRFIHHKAQPKSKRALASDVVVALHQDSKGAIWVGTEGGGLHRLDPLTDRFERFLHSSKKTPLLSAPNVYTILEDHKGFLWVGTFGGGLNVFNPKTATFTSYLHSHKKNRSLSNNNVNTILEDGDRIMWVGTNGGLNRFDRKTSAFQRFLSLEKNPFSINNNGILSLCDRNDGLLWVGTFGGGLNVLEKSSGRFLRITTEQGLPNDVIYGIVDDGKGRMWLSTNKGLCSIKPFTPEIVHRLLERVGQKSSLDRIEGRGDWESLRIRNYFAADGLQSDEFSQGAYHKGRGGHLYFGGINGLTMFHPDSIRENAYVPPVAITELQFYNSTVTPDHPSGILTENIASAQTIVLKPDQKVFTLAFAALSFIHPERNLYAYKLEGFDEDWNYRKADHRYATYTNLDPGEYVFHVKASNNDGLWNNEGATLRIVVLPPWYETTWARILFVVLGIVLIAGIFLSQKQRLLRKERAAAQLREAHLRAEAAELEAAAAESQAKAVEAEASVAKARAQVLEADNLRKEMELAKAREIEDAYRQLAQSHEELKATQSRLVQQEKMASLGSLTAGIAHEIKNPLNFVTNFAALNVKIVKDLKKETESVFNEETGEGPSFGSMLLTNLQTNSEKILDHGKRADSIVKGMLAHANGGTGERQVTNVNAFVEEYVNLAYHGFRAQNTGINLEVKQAYDPSAGQANIVPQEISRVLLNILGNAFYAVHHKSKDAGQEFKPVVTVLTRDVNGMVELRISDNGHGISEEHQKKIFEPFFTTKPTGQGTGLGLSLSYDIVVKGHSGSMSFESKLGEGTTFIIQFPRT